MSFKLTGLFCSLPARSVAPDTVRRMLQGTIAPMNVFAATVLLIMLVALPGAVGAQTDVPRPPVPPSRWHPQPGESVQEYS